ncbi:MULTISPECIES: YegP family protein [unclassified Caballeronia]|uniref:YegP family protein n=1 Tax=unclassified Caballeronia TaxID=2646786 RepID=UPI0020296E5F|nr:MULTISPECIES: YegP family protein [unclassified Caballeronia]
MNGRFIIHRAKNGEYHFDLHAGNGEIILSSQLYADRESVDIGIKSVRENAPRDERYERTLACNDQPMFNLKAANHKVIGTSQRYSSVEARDNGIASVKEHAPDAKVVAHT